MTKADNLYSALNSARTALHWAIQEKTGRARIKQLSQRIARLEADLRTANATA